MAASIIRTVVTYVVALLLGWAAKVGLNIDSNAVFVVVTAVIGFVYYTVVRLLEQQWPWLGRLLLSAGLVGQQPVYVRYAKGGKVIPGQAERVAEEHWPQPGQRG